MLGAGAKRIVHPIRKPRNNADEAIAAKPGRDGAGRAICCVAPLANGGYHWLRAASCVSSRRASVATTRDLCRGSLLIQMTLNRRSGAVRSRRILLWLRAPFALFRFGDRSQPSDV